MEWTLRRHDYTDYWSVKRPTICDFCDDSRLYTFSNISIAAAAEACNWAAPARTGRYGPSTFMACHYGPSIKYKSHLPASLVQQSWTGRRAGPTLYGLQPQWKWKRSLGATWIGVAWPTWLGGQCPHRRAGCAAPWWRGSGSPPSNRMYLFI
jgi:hypothetical protein